MSTDSGAIHGRYPLHLFFASGERWVWKPRGGEPEQLLNAVLARLSASTGIHWPIYQPISAAVGTWWPSISVSDALNPEECAHFFRACGVVLAAAHVLRLSDLNHENVLVHCGLPQVVDAEFILQPSLARLHGRKLQAVRQRFEASVLATLMLPLPGVAQDYSVLGNVRGSYTAAGNWCRSQHRPSVTGTGPVNASDYVLELCDGFEVAYRVLEQDIESLWVLGQAFEGRIRLAVRPTREYVAAQRKWRLERSYYPNSLSVLRQLLRDGLHLQNTSLADTLVDCEVSALLAGDIPFFYTEFESTDIISDRGIAVGGGLFQTPKQALKDRLERLNLKDCHRQLWDIREAMLSVMA